MRTWLILLLMLLFSEVLSSQSNHISSADGGFENPGGFLGNGWIAVNTSQNNWVIDNSAGPFSGSNSAYISNNGSSFIYTSSVSQTSHFYRDITIPAGETCISLSFKIKSVGEPFFDRLLVYTAPTSVTPLANLPLSSSTVLTGATLIYTDPGNQSNYSNVNVIINPALAGTTFRLIFTWQNDNTGVSNSPVSVDDISVISSAGGPLNGVYTINPLQQNSSNIPLSGSNFSSFTSAINYLNNFGVSGPVYFNVPTGTQHNEQLLNITVSGTASNNITFGKQGAGSNPVINPLRGTSTTDAAVQITGGDYIIFDGIDINAPISPTSAQVNIEFGYYLRNASATNGSSNCKIKNCSITLSNNFTTNVGVYIQAFVAPTTNLGANNNNLIDSVTVFRSYVGIRDLSNATVRNDANTISHCVLGISASFPIGNPTLTTTTNAIQVINPQNCTIKGNIIKYVTANNAVDGIYIQTATGTNTVSHNQVSGIRNSGTASTQIVTGIRVTLNNGAQANIFNNFIYDISHAYTTTTLSTKLVKGLSVQPLTAVGNTTVFNVDFNSVHIDGSASPNVTTSCLDIVQSGPIVNIRNNILSNITPNQAGSPAHYCVTAPTTTIAASGSLSNRNDFYCPFTSNGFVGQTATTNRSLLSDWRTATGQDLNSLSVDPLFLGTQNLHVLSQNLDSAASFNGISWISDDIDGDPRSSSFPDIGADEFSLLIFDIEMQALVQPANNSGCFGANQPIRVRIKNLAGQSHDFSSYPVFVQIDISGPINTLLLTQINDNSLVGGPLGSLQTLIYDAGVLDMSQYGNYTFRCKVYFPQDQNFSNDSINPVVITNSFPITLPSSVSFNSYNGTNLNSVFPDWREAIGQSPTGTVSSWTSASGLGAPANVSARLSQIGSGSYNWIKSDKMHAAFNSLLKFDAAICTPFAFTRDTMGADDRLDIMVSTDCGITFFKIDSFDISDGWNENLQSVVVPLSQFAAQDIIVGLRAYNGQLADADYDLHLDNIMLFNSNDADIALTEIVNPIQQNCFASNLSPVLKFKNLGFVDINFSQTPLTVNILASGPTNLFITDTLRSGIVNPGNEYIFTFSDSLNLTVAGQYTVTAFIALSGGDVNSINDTSSVIIFSQNPVSAINTARDTICIGSSAIVFSGITARGSGINDLPAFSYQGLPVAIPDANPLGVSIPLSVSGAAEFAGQLVAVNIGSLIHQYIGDIRLELYAPNGSKILLSELIGVAGNAYTNTVFRMNATNSISDASAPFTGNYIPLEHFSSLSGTANGTWLLRVTDLASGDLGSVSSWSLVFKEPNSITSFSWQSQLAGSGFSIDSALYTVNQQATVNFIANDVFGCQAHDSIELFIPEDVQWSQSPIMACGAAQITLGGATPVGGIYSGNGVANGILNTSLAGNGSQIIDYHYQSAQGCTDSASIVANISLLNVSIGQIQQVSCNGYQNASATVIANQQFGNTNFSWNDLNSQNTATATNLPAGNYSVTVSDSICTTQIPLIITEPANLNATLSVSAVSCFGYSNGGINLTAVGGVGPYSFIWSEGNTTEDLSGAAIGIYTVTLTDANGCSVSNSETITEPSLLQSSIISNNVACFGSSDGAVNLTPSGGTFPFSFSWSNGATTEDLASLSAGPYSITVTDNNGCISTASLTLTEPAAINPNAVQTNISCFGSSDGAVNLTPSGGIFPFSFSWSNGASTEDLASLSAGSYNVTVTDNNGCISTVSLTLIEPAAINPNDVRTNISCFGSTDGAVNLTPSGGTLPYSFSWSNGATAEDLASLSAGTYTITVTDSEGCANTASITITEPAAINPNAVQTNISCFGSSDGAVNLTPSGGTLPYSFSWSNGATAEDLASLTAGTYTVTVNDANSCLQLFSVTILQPDSISVLYNVTDETINANGSVSVNISGGNLPYSFDWSNGQSTQNISGLTGGNYTLTITDANNCVRIITLIVQSFVSTEVVENEQGILLYPNPADESIYFKSEFTNYDNLTIFDATGRLYASYLNGSLSDKIDVSMLVPGIYIIRINNGNFQSDMKFIKK